MDHTLRNEVISMPLSSNQHSSDQKAAELQHRSPQKAGTGDAPTLVEKAEPDALSTEVFAVFGVEPEMQAYAMA